MKLIFLHLLLLQVTERSTNSFSLPYQAIQFPDSKNRPHQHYCHLHNHHFQHDSKFHLERDNQRFEHDHNYHHFNDEYFESNSQYHRDINSRTSTTYHDQLTTFTTANPPTTEQSSTKADTILTGTNTENDTISFDLRTNFQSKKNCRLVTATGRCIK